MSNGYYMTYLTYERCTITQMVELGPSLGLLEPNAAVRGPLTGAAAPSSACAGGGITAL